MDVGRAGTSNKRITKALAKARFREPMEDLKSLKLLEGTLSVTMRTPLEQLLEIDNVEKSAGKVVKAAELWLKLSEIQKDADGDYLVRVEVRQPSSVQLGANGANLPMGNRMRLRVAMMGDGESPWLMGSDAFKLLDPAGQPYKHLRSEKWNFDFDGEAYIHRGTLVFRPTKPDQSGPARLTLNGTREVAVTVGFSLRNVPLP
jgi:hypothetical protein